ncbi:MAG: aminodeoxychorismate synthase component I [Victivallales bacterium]|nr:aminodeoxychorismate synthase component I [Victivallales bacterium]
MDKTAGKPGRVVCRLPGGNQWGIFTEPVKVLCGTAINQVNAVLTAVETATEEGLYAAGFIAYEAGAAFDPAFPRRSLPDFPLIWFGLYDRTPAIFEPAGELFARTAELFPELTESEYYTALDVVLADIEAGNLYQTNFTFRLRGARTDAPWRLFNALAVRHPMPYAAFVDTGDRQLVSLSPELFLARVGNDLFSSPMKGTIKTGGDPAADHGNIEFLKTDPKNTAENLMIVDMTRNDLGRICRPGSIFVEPLFHVDSYPTLHQMISTVHGEVSPDTTFGQIVRAAFPPASITGAPKIAAMRKIQALEKSPRGIYTGSIGCVLPNRNCCLNVAIRTLVCSGETTELGVGGGIVYDSDKAAEWEEADLKSRFIHAAEPDFKILETMLFEPASGISDLDAHLVRMNHSAVYFDFRCNVAGLRELIVRQSAAITTTSRLRLLLDFSGQAELQVSPLEKTGWNHDPAIICLAAAPTSAADLLLRHKTTRRDFYDKHFRLAVTAGYDEVIFTNDRGEITEGAISNLFLRDPDGSWYTPPISSGLLPGIWRAAAIRELKAREKILYPDDLYRASQILIGNSVRGKSGAGIKKDYPRLALSSSRLNNTTPPATATGSRGIASKGMNSSK